MAEKSNNQKKSAQKPQSNMKKTEKKEVIETPVKKSFPDPNTPIYEYLSPFTFPPKRDYTDSNTYRSNYNYSNQYVQINTPIASPRHKMLQNLDYPGITTKIVFQPDSQDEENISDSFQSSLKEEQSDNDSLPNSQQPQLLSQQNQQQSSQQPSEQKQSNLQKELKNRNKSIKPRSTPSQPNQTNPNKKVFCNCKKSKCLKLYCDCFRLNQTCDGCNCVGCHNLEIYAEQRNNAILSLMDRNPDPFGQKIEDHKHVKGCNCKKSNCLKKYCECYQAGLKCGENCKCEECKNMPCQKGGPQGDKGAYLSKNTAKKQKKMVEM